MGVGVRRRRMVVWLELVLSGGSDVFAVRVRCHSALHRLLKKVHEQMDPATAAKAAAAGCPVAHDIAAGGAAAAMKAAASAATGCPVDHGKHGFPANSEMPVNQKPSQGQRRSLATDRAVSNIPSADGSEPLWVYPSQQQFYNAMKRKGYAPQEEEMDAVVAIHNAVNERAWAEVRACTCNRSGPALRTH